MSLPQGFFAIQAERVGDVQVASRSQDSVSVASQGVNPTVKEMYHLCSKVSTSWVSYRDTVKHLSFIFPEHIDKITCNTARDTHTHKYRDTTQHIHFAPLDNMEGNQHSRGWHSPHPSERLGCDNSTAGGLQTKVPWTRLYTRAIQFFCSSLVHNSYTWTRTVGCSSLVHNSYTWTQTVGCSSLLHNSYNWTRTLGW
jgi:hypothetical protein